MFPDGSSIDETEESRLLPITAGWVFDDLLPAGVMLALALAVIAVSLQTRNRRQAPSSIDRRRAASRHSPLVRVNWTGLLSS
ncbi:hypothetical protein [Leucobacter soli]|uniref:hypothetical protein n=1 Tax=Leucobacter soli TaxID=2812850 RepID=UPI0036098FCA